MRETDDIGLFRFSSLPFETETEFKERRIWKEDWVYSVGLLL